MRTIHCALIAAGLLATTAPAVAKDNLGYAAIQAGDYSAAERSINAERRIFPDMPELLLNLAVVYQQTGRKADARELYIRVLQQDEVMLDTSARTSVSSYDVARAGLARLKVVFADRNN